MSYNKSFNLGCHKKKKCSVLNFQFNSQCHAEKIGPENAKNLVNKKVRAVNLGIVDEQNATYSYLCWILR